MRVPRPLEVSLALLLAGASLACASDRPSERTSDRASDAEWMRGLQGKPAVTRGEVLLAAGLLLDDAHWEPRPAWALRSARDHGLVRGGDAADLDGAATRAYGCAVFARALRIRGGVMMRVTGQAGRYAFRELRLHGLIPDGPSHLKLTGDELVGLLDGATKYREHGPTRPPGI